MKPALRWLLFLSLPLFLADQATKWLVLRNVEMSEVIQLFPGFLNIVHVHNTGAAFGMLKDSNAFFVLLAGAALVVVGVLAWKGAFAGMPTKIGAALLVSGILGNLTDRLLHGHVVDFIDVILPWYGHWPAFNIADSCICIAAGLFILDGLVSNRSPQR